MLPAGWEAHLDPEGRTYYCNSATGETTWEPPAMQLPEGWAAHQDDQGRTFYHNSITGETSWEPPADAPAAAPPAPAAPIGNWSVDFTYTLGPVGSEDMFSGKAQLLDKSVYSSVSAVVDSLNQGVPSVPEGYCVVFSNSKQNYFLLWREDKEAEAFAVLGIGTDSESWSTSQVYKLEGWAEANIAGRADILDQARYDSVSNAVEALNAGIVHEGARGYCVVFSASQQCLFLLWHKDKEADAFAMFGIQ
eukprot:TRINITY_DN212_c1_g1_i1.p1 TRINITY_DN212_c1_g1~~TRINITY_DN212_c1_g1_i1.p1  ORF type:complete len:249 (+),score=51.50 TRINITY_DN212_c1_g1_i1:87-833(+)